MQVIFRYLHVLLGHDSIVNGGYLYSKQAALHEGSPLGDVPLMSAFTLVCNAKGRWTE